MNFTYRELKLIQASLALNADLNDHEVQRLADKISNEVASMTPPKIVFRGVVFSGPYCPVPREEGDEGPVVVLPSWGRTYK